MSNSALRGRHAAVSKKNLTRAGASLAVTGGLVAGIATATTSGSSAAEPTSARSTLKAASATPAPQANASEAKSSAAKKAPATTKTQEQVGTHAQAASNQVSRGQARRAISEHATPKPAKGHALKASKHAAVAAAPATLHSAKTAHPKPAVAAKRSSAPRPAVTATTAAYAKPAAATTSTTTQQASAAVPSASGGVISAAQRYSGIPYVWGGSSTSGADCSGYVAMVYKSVGKTLPHSSSAMQSMATPVSNPQPGDLVFSPGHVAIYAGSGKAYQALHPGTTSGLHPIYSSNVSYGRV